MFNPTSRHLEACNRLRILVVGDVMLDHYLRGTVERTSPEAPVPVLRVEAEDYILGGAANVAHNLAVMGARVDLAGIIGNDANGPILKQLLDKAGIGSSLLAVDKARPTTLKTRALAQGQQILRIDREVAHPVSGSVEGRFLASLKQVVHRYDGVLFSDYGKGVLTPVLLSALIGECRRLDKPTTADPKGLQYRRYRGIDYLTPNQKETQAASGIEIVDEKSLRRAVMQLHRQVLGKAICVTRGAQGVAVFPCRGRAVHIPAHPREVYDVTGAGDTFIAHLSLGLFQGLELAQAAAWGNLAAGIVVGRLGVAVVSPGELLSEAAGDRGWVKHRTLDELEPIVRSLRAAGKRVVFTNGCFDLLHVGHLRLLESARALGDCLIVAINSDESVRAVKGRPRPLLPENERAAILASLDCVDYVTVFRERSPERLLRVLKPDVLAKGGNLEPEEVVGREIVQNYGGAIQLLPLFGERSVSGLLEQWGASKSAGAPPSGTPALQKRTNRIQKDKSKTIARRSRKGKTT